jgi:hypothetical protein
VSTICFLMSLLKTLEMAGERADSGGEREVSDTAL